MLYLNLIQRNLRRSMKNYIVFMITMCITSMLLYSFNCVMFSEQAQAQMLGSEGITQMYVTIDILIVFIFAWLISYVSRFMLTHRSKEFGLYLLSGMKRKSVANMFIAEMFAMNLVAFAIGSIMGVAFYQVIELIIMKTFTSAYTFSVEISPITLVVSFTYYLLMWVFALFRLRRTIMKVKIRTLLYQDVENETIKRKKYMTVIQFVLVLSSFLCGLYNVYQGIWGMVSNTMDAPGQMFLIGIILLIFSVYMFYFLFSNLIDVFFQHFHRLKYHKDTLLLYGHIKGRIRSNRMVLGTLSALTIISLLMITFTIQYKDMIDNTINEQFDYDIQINDYSEKGLTNLNLDAIHDLLHKEGYTYKDTIISIYSQKELAQKMSITSNVKDISVNLSSQDLNFNFMTESDFRNLLTIKGAELPSPLQEGEYGIAFTSTYADETESFLPKLELILNNTPQTLAFAEVKNINNYSLGIIILPDENMAGVTGGFIKYNAVVDGETELGLESKLSEIALKEGGMLSLSVKTDSIHEGLTGYLYMAFILLYLALAFICVQATILATQQLMDIETNQYSYQTLHKLGVRKKALSSLLFRQIGLYFFLPLLLPVIYVIPLLPTLQILFTNVTMTINIYMVFLASLGIYLIVYFCYFLLAYINGKRSLGLYQ